MEKVFDELEETSLKTGRRLAREELFKLVFESEIKNEDIKEIYALYLQRDNKPSLKEEELAFVKKYIYGIADSKATIKEKIEASMENWKIERIGLIEKSLLTISVYELLKENIATEISVNEAVELAKEYGDTKTYEFLNGVLAKIIKTIN